jgi:hypothetical protein
MTEPEPVKPADADLLVSGEFEVPEDMFTADLPPAIRKDRRKLCRIRRADLRARQVYDVMDQAILRLRELREKLKGRSLRK